MKHPGTIQLKARWTEPSMPVTAHGEGACLGADAAPRFCCSLLVSTGSGERHRKCSVVRRRRAGRSSLGVARHEVLNAVQRLGLPWASALNHRKSPRIWKLNKSKMTAEGKFENIFI